MSKLTVFHYHKTELAIAGQMIHFRVARLTNDEVADLQHRFAAYWRWREEVGPREDDTPDQQRAREAQRDKDWREDFGPFFAKTITERVRVEPGEMTEHDDESGEDREVVTGADVWRLFGAQIAEVAIPLVVLVITCNAGTEAQKNALRSRFASEPGLLKAPPKAATGDGSAPTATDAGEKDGTVSVDATDPTLPPTSERTTPDNGNGNGDTPSSGMTDPSLSEGVR